MLLRLFQAAVAAGIAGAMANLYLVHIAPGLVAIHEVLQP